MEGRIDGFICAAGTGGTVAGVGLGLKEEEAAAIIALADPHGAALYSYYAEGELKAEGTSFAEGIGRAVSPPISRVRRSTHSSAFRTRRGWNGCAACSPRKACALACRAASMSRAPFALPATWDPVIRSSRCSADYGTRYQSRLFNPKFLREKGLPVPEWLDQGQAAAPRVFV